MMCRDVKLLLISVDETDRCFLGAAGTKAQPQLGSGSMLLFRICWNVPNNRSPGWAIQKRASRRAEHDFVVMDIECRGCGTGVCEPVARPL